MFIEISSLKSQWCRNLIGFGYEIKISWEVFIFKRGTLDKRKKKKKKRKYPLLIKY